VRIVLRAVALLQEAIDVAVILNALRALGGHKSDRKCLRDKPQLKLWLAMICCRNPWRYVKLY
jgi:hypothetical protein